MKHKGKKDLILQAQSALHAWSQANGREASRALSQQLGAAGLHFEQDWAVYLLLRLARHCVHGLLPRSALTQAPLRLVSLTLPVREKVAYVTAWAIHKVTHALLRCSAGLDHPLLPHLELLQYRFLVSKLKSCSSKILLDIVNTRQTCACCGWVG
jgi:hypothetical protein